MSDLRARQSPEREAVRAAGLPPNCQIEPIEEIRNLFVDEFQKVRIDKGEKPAERAVFRKQHGAARARLSVVAACPAAFRVGLWAAGPYEAWVRWSSDAPPDTPDQKNNTLGFAIKLFGVSGPTLATDNPKASTADLIFQNSDIFFVDNAAEMCAISADFNAFVANHKRSDLILKEMAKQEKSLLTARYSSTLPYALGSAIAKYRLVAERTPDDAPPSPSPNYLAEDLKRRLKTGAISFLLEAQSFVDQSVTPVDRATVRWEEELSPFVSIARLDIAAQDLDQDGQAAYGESLAFSPWRTLHDNRPLGSIADARRIAYPASAALRRSVNGQSMQEPEQPR
ncbi:MAG TPA: hypothetical protein VII39_08005 [Bradyrhizobium sp.]